MLFDAPRYLAETFPIPVEELLAPGRRRALRHATALLLHLYATADRRSGTGTVTLADYARRAGISYATAKRHRDCLERAGVASFAVVRGAGGIPALRYALPQYPTENPADYARAVASVEPIVLDPALPPVERLVVRIDGRVVRS